MIKLTPREKQVLTELLKDCKVSDQEIARRLKTSRPTVFKIRERLEKEGIIKSYVPLVNFEKLNLNLQAVILYRWRDYSKTSELEKIVKLIKSMPEVILFIKGEGMGSKTDLIISIHEDIKDYERFIRKLKYEWKDHAESIEVFLSSIDGISKGYDFSSPAIQKINEKIIYSK
jgi:DNA-binding Lrp family transcriptional regulator